jgi:hypothetical protein
MIRKTLFHVLDMERRFFALRALLAFHCLCVFELLEFGDNKQILFVLLLA